LSAGTLSGVRMGCSVVALLAIAGCGGTPQRTHSAPPPTHEAADSPGPAPSRGVSTIDATPGTSYRIVGTPLVTMATRDGAIGWVVLRIDRALPRTRSKRVAAMSRVGHSPVRRLRPFGRPAEHCYLGFVFHQDGSPALPNPFEGQSVTVDVRITGERLHLTVPGRLQFQPAHAVARQRYRAIGCTLGPLVKTTYSLDDPTPTPSP
jgi:hypothetical protein